MKKILLFTLTFFMFNVLVAQYINRLEVAFGIYDELYNDSPNSYEASQFPNPFFDIPNDNNLTEYTDAKGNVTKFFYDSDENPIKIEDAFNNSIFFTYDTYGQLLSKTNQEGMTINYTYENDGAVTSITAPANIESTFTYDGINHLLERIDNGRLILDNKSTISENQIVINVNSLTNGVYLLLLQNHIKKY